MNEDSELDDSLEMLELEVPPELAGLRFDQALAQLAPDWSRSRLTEWIKAGKALLDGRQARPRDPVPAGARIHLTAEPQREVRAEGEAIPLEVLYADDDVIVINKGVGLVVHPGAGNPSGTLLNALLHFDPKLAEVPRAGLVHRLDKETTGAMVIARNLKAHTALVEQLAERDVHRQYLAVVVGVLVAGGTVDAPIARHPRDRIRMAVVENGRPAVTHYRVRERFRGHSLLECRLETGRTHQIRVHMAHLRHPIVGDPLYGGPLKLPKGASAELVEALRGFRRQALHAERLEFSHPRSGETVSFSAPLPPDTAELLTRLRRDSAALDPLG
jgi:23S rRNA pseudouridine1911/1915/1917 synthase